MVPTTTASNRHYEDNNENNSIYDIDVRLGKELRSSLDSIFEKNEKKLRKLKDVKTLMDCYKKTREHKEQIEKQGILSLIVNKITEELLKQVEPYYVGSIVRNIEIQTRFKKEEDDDGTVEVNSKVDFDASLKPYIEFVIEINKKKTYLVKFTFQIDTSAHVKKLRFTYNADEGGLLIHIEKLGIKIELSLLQIEFSDLIASGSQISFNKKMKLGSKSFEIHDLSSYTRHVSSNRENMVCPKCDTINPLESKYCANCSLRL